MRRKLVEADFSGGKSALIVKRVALSPLSFIYCNEDRAHMSFLLYQANADRAFAPKIKYIPPLDVEGLVSVWCKDVEQKDAHRRDFGSVLVYDPAMYRPQPSKMGVQFAVQSHRELQGSDSIGLYDTLTDTVTIPCHDAVATNEVFVLYLHEFVHSLGIRDERMIARGLLRKWDDPEYPPSVSDELWGAILSAAGQFP